MLRQQARDRAGSMNAGHVEAASILNVQFLFVKIHCDTKKYAGTVSLTFMDMDINGNVRTWSWS